MKRNERDNVIGPGRKGQCHQKRIVTRDARQKHLRKYTALLCHTRGESGHTNCTPVSQPR